MSPPDDAAFWKSQFQNARRQRWAEIAVHVAGGALLGALIFGSFAPTLSELIEENPETAAHELCNEGYIVTLPGVGNLCDDG